VKKYIKLFILLVIVAVFAANGAVPQTTYVTYAAQEVSQDDADVPSLWAGPEIDKARSLNLLTEKIHD
jgi:hypothetical protein